jgi:hypothetical protein
VNREQALLSHPSGKRTAAMHFAAIERSLFRIRTRFRSTKRATARRAELANWKAKHGA